MIGVPFADDVGDPDPNVGVQRLFVDNPDRPGVPGNGWIADGLEEACSDALTSTLPPGKLLDCAVLVRQQPLEGHAEPPTVSWCAPDGRRRPKETALGRGSGAPQF